MIRLKDLNLPSVVVQSPMANCTDLPFRLIARRRGMKLAYLEMVSAHALVNESRKTFELMKTLPEDRPVGCQLVGCDPEIMGRAARMVEDMGCYDLVDINLGCPVPKITGHGGGSALLKEPEKARLIFREMVKNLRHLPLTVKMRLGFSDETGKEACEIAKIAEQEGLDGIAVHGRTRAQQYTGKANYEAVGRVRDAVKIPVFGNGDVFDGASALHLKKTSGVDGIMIGRGALGNPWIYREVEAALEGRPLPPPPTFEEKKQTLVEHMELELAHNPRSAHLQMRRVACWYFKDMPGAARFRERVNRCTSVEELREIIQGFDPSRSGEAPNPENLLH
ncbi:MAG TPA: tRNA dihydrouridine synthase DusB [Verrucomicrobiae bacterium]|jgi:nifR3 family TIM-barrel protein|nr:tRNA dihydrouridine synthase DusB [Verrucomicrobiae bacterium]